MQRGIGGVQRKANPVILSLGARRFLPALFLTSVIKSIYIYIDQESIYTKMFLSKLNSQYSKGILFSSKTLVSLVSGYVTK